MSTPTEVAPRAAGPSVRAVQRAERRALILAATVRILTGEGIDAVTHRAVAREAGVPLAATTYYFDSKDELIAEALALLVEDEIARLAARAAELGEAIRSPRDSAAAITEVLLGDAAEAGVLLAKLEVYLDAARRPGLRAAAAEWLRGFTALAESSLRLAGAADPEALAPLVIAGVDGILVHELAAGPPDAEAIARMRGRFERLFALVLERG